MNYELFIDKVKLALQKRSPFKGAGGSGGNKRCYAAWKAKGHIKEPLVSFVIQSHNKSLQVCHILDSLRQNPNSEIIVIDDGSSLDHTQRLAAALTGANEFMVRANDLYENVTYDKCLRFANGKYVALLQDDDDIIGTDWVERAVRHFEEHPDMAILGGCDGRSMHFIIDKDGNKNYEGAGMEQGDFSFVMAVNRAPMWINHDLYKQHLHHIDYSYAPFQFDDDELCLRAWLTGLKVGWYRAHFSSLSVGGMRLYNNAFANEMTLINAKKLYDTFADKETDIITLVEKANKELHDA